MRKVLKLKIGVEELILETGVMAKQANGSVFATYGGSSVLATVCCSDRIQEDLDFIPLSVEYNEKYYAAGKIPGGFIKREGKPKDKEVLVSRLIDRPLRPLLDKRFGREIQIVPTTFSTDQKNPPDIIGMNATFAAVFISNIPFNGPVAAVRIVYLNNEFIVNPTFSEVYDSELDIVVAGGLEGITMVEGGASEVDEEILLQAIEKAHVYIKELCKLQFELLELAGKKEKLPLAIEEKTLEWSVELKDFAYPKLCVACFVKGKCNRDLAIKAVKKETYEYFIEFKQINDSDRNLMEKYLKELEKQIVRKYIFDKRQRTDNRTPTEIRDIDAMLDVLIRTHGSALFTRGETQALAITTLGTSIDEQIMDDIDGDERLNFMLHYNFPPFSVGETGRLMVGRREIGHGYLAKRSLEAVMPNKEDFPYTVRVVSEVLESNGSSSMATVCAGSMSLMAAGVPIKSQVAGIAMGLISEADKYIILSDILGEEDHLGDMDFKVAGTKKGITGFQMDIKIPNITKELMRLSLLQAKEGRIHILSKMDSVINRSRVNISEYAPKILQMLISVDKISLIIGSGGKNIKWISEGLDVNVQIEQNGKLIICAGNDLALEEAKKRIDSIIREPKIGEIYHGTIKKVTQMGAFIELTVVKDGFLNARSLPDDRKIRLQIDQKLKVRVKEIDIYGKISLSLVRES